MPLSYDPVAEARRLWESHGWAEAAPGMAAVTTVARVHQILIRRVDVALAPHRLSFARFEILRLLSFSSRGSLPMGKIGQRLQVHPASITEGVKRLEADGFARRRDDPDDGRITVAELLPAGRRVLVGATESLNEVFVSLGPGREDLALLKSLLDQIRATAGDPVEDAARDELGPIQEGSGGVE